MIDLCNDTVFMTFMYVYNLIVLSCYLVILLYYIHDILVRLLYSCFIYENRNI